MTAISNIQALATMPRFSVGEWEYGGGPPSKWGVFNNDLAGWMRDGNTSTVIDLIAAGTPPANLVTDENADPKIIIGELLQNDVQRGALAQLELEQRQKEQETLRQESGRIAKIAELEAYSRSRREPALEQNDQGGVMLDGFSPAIAQPEAVSKTAQYYEQGRHDFVMGGVSPLQPLEVSSPQVGLPALQENKDLGTPSRLGLSVAALAAASQCGASINKYSSCSLAAANDIAMPQAVGTRRTTVMARAA